ncbi:PREDICTED: phospholipase A2 inhibitor and Ly6/PLAUR domain-containing protein isoform X2 [Chinchilla lanigera]|uniref:Phospholipase A2 inhibitor and LY6/PLAUR domain containing n=1 Tax=Chinchilla lanigera TaxID=34839 RepID=A0A8C2UMD4_CHILA|nr:PREDICTED: phospholipase A2 inhibitor and Ly6/PLAUR domain-containing protein isoform X2 [Chinchilla lanigera]
MGLSTRQDTFLLAFMLFCTLVGPGCGLTCEVCNGPEDTCSGKMKQCEQGKDTCAIIVSESHEKGPYVSTVKACMKSRDCHTGYVSTTMGPNNYMVTNTHCCQSDGCNRGSVPAPQYNRTVNGLLCPSCVVPFRDTCAATQLAQCVGQETHCIYLAGRAKAGIISAKFATRGCATESACRTKAGAEVPSASYHYFLHRADCHEATTLPYGRAE